eukprot:1365375-Amphidinium_carterae.1
MGFLAKGCLLYQRPPGMRLLHTIACRWSTRKYSTNHITPGHLAVRVHQRITATRAYTARNKKRFIMVREGTWYCEADWLGIGFFGLATFRSLCSDDSSLLSRSMAEL